MRRPAPRIGQHNAEILAELGITMAEPGITMAEREQEMPA
jgi:crotonobetainyl-CoA:carnitine CoA-transferase CaiB-like acyl-CoA transferase